MSEIISSESPWWYSRLTDYYDVNMSAVERNAERLAQLDDEEREVALRDIRAGVLAHMRAFDYEWLPKVAVSLADDLYKFGCTTAFWDETKSDYVNAVWGTAFPFLTTAGVQVRYVIDNTWPDGLQRPLHFFPELFTQAGMSYVCPHAIALAIPEASGAEESVEGLSGLMTEARDVARQVVSALDDGRMHFVYLEVDLVDGALDYVRGLPRTPGTVDMFRVDPGLPGTRIQVYVEPLG